MKKNEVRDGWYYLLKGEQVQVIGRAGREKVFVRMESGYVDFISYRSLRPVVSLEEKDMIPRVAEVVPVESSPLSVAQWSWLTACRYKPTPEVWWGVGDLANAAIGVAGVAGLSWLIGSIF